MRGGLLFGCFLLATQEKVTRTKRENVLSALSDDAPAGCQPLIFLNEAKCNNFAAHAAPTTASNLDCAALHPGYVLACQPLALNSGAGQPALIRPLTQGAIAAPDLFRRSLECDYFFLLARGLAV